MSTFKHPVGPQPSRVYWRRRLLVLLGLVAVVVIVLLIVSRLSPAPADDSPTSTNDKSASTTDAEPDPEPSEEPSEELVEGADCLPANVVVESVADSISYSADQLPQLSFTITNTGSASCMFNVGSTQQTFVITSGQEQYWSSKDCEKDPVDAPMLLEPNVAVSSQPIPWDRTRSSTATCDTERPRVPSGGATYALKVTVGAIESASAKTFLLY